LSLEARDHHERALARKLAARYPLDRWALVPQVRSSLGGRVQGLRVADLVAVDFWPSDRGRIELVEIKVSTTDLRRETPEKSAPFVEYASACWIAVPAPWQRVVRSKGDLPDGWGLLSIGTGAPAVIVRARERRPAKRLSPFALALLRAAVANTSEHRARDAPLVEVIRPFLSRGHVGLACHHVAMSLAKRTPEGLPCLGCRDGRPTDPEAIEAAIADATPEQRARYAVLCGERGLP
jgi:hypothetical protein